jgi:hypothetical protein
MHVPIVEISIVFELNGLRIRPLRRPEIAGKFSLKAANSPASNRLCFCGWQAFLQQNRGFQGIPEPGGKWHACCMRLAVPGG